MIVWAAEVLGPHNRPHTHHTGHNLPNRLRRMCSWAPCSMSASYAFLGRSCRTAAHQAWWESRCWPCSAGVVKLSRDHGRGVVSTMQGEMGEAPRRCRGAVLLFPAPRTTNGQRRWRGTMHVTMVAQSHRRTRRMPREGGNEMGWCCSQVGSGWQGTCKPRHAPVQLRCAR